MGMTRAKAKEYLKDHGELDTGEYKPRTKREAERLNKQQAASNEKKIQQVMKKGKIYGDPVAEVQW